MEGTVRRGEKLQDPRGTTINDKCKRRDYHEKGSLNRRQVNLRLRLETQSQTKKTGNSTHDGSCRPEPLVATSGSLKPGRGRC